MANPDPIISSSASSPPHLDTGDRGEVIRLHHHVVRLDVHQRKQQVLPSSVAQHTDDVLLTAPASEDGAINQAKEQVVEEILSCK